MTGRILSVVLAMVVALVLSGTCPLARFTGETITIDVLGERIRVDGTYIYENPLPFPIRQGMSVPLPPGNEPIALQLTRENEPIPLRHMFGAYRFELPLHAHETATVRLRYEQYTPSHHATYLLTTTAPWHRPLDNGSYEIRAHGHPLIRSSYALTNGVFRRQHFMPPTDWSFAWQ